MKQGYPAFDKSYAWSDTALTVFMLPHAIRHSRPKWGPKYGKACLPKFGSDDNTMNGLWTN